MKLTESQRSLLYRLAMPSGNPVVRNTHYVRGRGPLASAQVLRRLGLAENVGVGSFDGEHWRITDAGVAERWNQ